jgi:hypothetical protein
VNGMSDADEIRAVWLKSLRPAVQDGLQRGETIAHKMVENAKQALASWAVRISFNTRVGPGQKLPLLLESSDLSGVRPGCQIVVSALETSAILAALRISDNAHDNDALTACQLVGLLHNEEIATALCDKSWTNRNGRPETENASEVAEQSRRIKWFTDQVPSRWGSKAFPPDSADLMNARSKLKGLRDKHFAHSDGGLTYLPTYGEVENAIIFSTEVARTASLIFLRWDSQLADPLSDQTVWYDQFWATLENGLREQSLP